ncbi:NUDIX hydrolase [Candidatus Microgenomates bacterium]|nr:NUDIX hydrolase [Candidatus Microgenomates bacterium]
MINCVFENRNETSLRHVVVHAIVEKDDRLLLEKRTPGILEGGKWGLPSGFLARDETASEGILRELKEETGWQGEIVSLFRINTNPDRPHEDRQNVAIEFIIKPIKQVSKPDQESTEIKWVSIENLPPASELAFDHGESIKLYLKYKNNPYPLPLFT